MLVVLQSDQIKLNRATMAITQFSQALLQTAAVVVDQKKAAPETVMVEAVDQAVVQLFIMLVLVELVLLTKVMPVVAEHLAMVQTAAEVLVK